MADDMALDQKVSTQPVSTTAGPVRGYEDGGLRVFKGVRYGAAPVGSLRFKPPRGPERWVEPVDTVSLGAPSIQSGLAAGERNVSPGDPAAPASRH